MLKINLFNKLIIFITIFIVNINISVAQQVTNQNIKLISLSPNITELIYEANAQDILLGASSYSNYPDDAKKIPIISDYKSLFIEKILTITKDYRKDYKNKDENTAIYALAWQGGNPLAFESILAKYNIKTIWLKSNTTQDIIINTNIIAQLASKNMPKDKQDIYLKNIYIKSLELSNIIYSIANKYKPYNKQSYFYPIWLKPLMILHGDNYTDNLLSNCNAYNIFKNNKTYTVSTEAIIINKPDIMIMSMNKQDKIEYENNLYVKIKRIAIDADLLVRPTSRSIYALDDICKKIH